MHTVLREAEVSLFPTVIWMQLAGQPLNKPSFHQVIIHELLALLYDLVISQILLLRGVRVPGCLSVAFWPRVGCIAHV